LAIAIEQLQLVYLDILSAVAGGDVPYDAIDGEILKRPICSLRGVVEIGLPVKLQGEGLVDRFSWNGH
jgi:hypothetical protein